MRRSLSTKLKIRIREGNIITEIIATAHSTSNAQQHYKDSNIQNKALAIQLLDLLSVGHGHRSFSSNRSSF